MRWGHALTAVLIMTMCGPDLGREPGAELPALRLLGRARCKDCGTVRIRVAGKGLDRVLGAELVPEGRDSTPLPATTSVRLVPGAQPELEVVASPRPAPPPGSYALRLRIEAAGRDGIVWLRNALQVESAGKPSRSVVRSGE